jgi:hypothetical protein
VWILAYAVEIRRGYCDHIVSRALSRDSVAAVVCYKRLLQRKIDISLVHGNAIDYGIWSCGGLGVR